MAVKSRGRGTVAALGLFLLFAGLVGGGVLYVVAQRRPGQVVDGFARAPIGCTTTLEFTETGVFYVYEEAGAKVDPVDGGCQPVVDPVLDFNVDFTGDLVPESVIDDNRVSYDVDGFDGRAVQRIEIEQAGTYSIAVRGDDVTVVAAIGRNPNDGVNDLRWWALLVATTGAALGILMLVLAGRRSKIAATAITPVGPGWGPGSHRPASSWPPQAPRLDQVPVNPQQPSEPAAPIPPPPALPERSRTEAATWGPPVGDAEALPPPDPDSNPPPPVPGVTPVLPDAPGRPSGT